MITTVAIDTCRVLVIFLEIPGFHSVDAPECPCFFQGETVEKPTAILYYCNKIYLQRRERVSFGTNKQIKQKNSHRTTKFEIAANSLKESACFFFIL
jgi:hypothetical protein